MHSDLEKVLASVQGFVYRNAFRVNIRDIFVTNLLGRESDQRFWCATIYFTMSTSATRLAPEE